MEESGVSKMFAIKIDERDKAAVFEPALFEEEDVEPEKDIVIPPHPPKRIKTIGNSEPEEPAAD
jgi:chromosome segregation protein